MGACDDRCVIEEPGRGLCVLPPQDRHHRLIRPCSYRCDRCFGEFLPAVTPVASWLSLLDGEHTIQQKHTLGSPRREIAAAGCCNAEIGREFGVDVGETSGNGSDVRGDGKRQANGVPRCRVWVLAHDHDADVVQRLSEGAKNVIARRCPWSISRGFGPQELSDRCEVVSLSGHVGDPGLVNQIVELLRHSDTLADRGHRWATSGGMHQDVRCLHTRPDLSPGRDAEFGNRCRGDRCG